MNELQIDYSVKGFLKIYSLLFASCTILFGSYLSVKEALANNYSFIFFCSLLLIVLAIIIILHLTLWRPKPLLVLNNKEVSTDITGQKNLTVFWEDVTEVNVGISSFIFILGSGKQVNIDLGSLVYNDLKQIKTRIIELCEIKNIPFRNI